MNQNRNILLSPEVEDALGNGLPVIALESTIISHGMPYPQNFNTAKKLESEIRKSGAVPATIAVIGGIINVGLDERGLEFMSSEKNILKASRRDLPVIITGKMNAATTVSATMICASIAGIKIFATGGIGGVHRNANETFDISADLIELSKTNITVVSAGVKSILDINLTLEYLETFGVPVIGYQTDRFPAFYTRDSGFDVNYRLDSAEDIASVIKTKYELGLEGGILIANPIPAEYSMDKKEIDKAIDDALIKAGKKGIRGKDITPFLLSEIKEITKGKSLDANIRLVLNNAKLASEIAKFLYNKS